jgi:DNA-binding transcriptional LysR family regulator
MAVTLRQIQYFVAVAETGKMSLAAHSLGISQSSITEAVKSLEDQAGAPLFRRHKSGVNLTDAGYQFLRHARNVLSTVADATHVIRQSQSPARVRGRFTLGVTYTVTGYFLSPVLERFRQSFPDVEVDLIERDREVIEALAAAGKIDMGVILVSNLRSRALHAEVLIRSKRRLWLAANHPLLRESRITLKRIAREPYVMLTIDEADKTAMRYWHRARVRPNVIFETSSIEAVRSLVANGTGVAILSDMVYRPWSLDGERVEVRTVDDEVPSMDVGMVWRRGRELSEGAAAFAEYCNIRFNNAAVSRLAAYE